MNSDYKSALDKIHLEQNKKEEMKQLFRKNNMRRKINFIKPAVAVAACMALVVGISPVSYTHLDVYKRQRLYCKSNCG